MREVVSVTAFVILLPFGALEDVERSTSADARTRKSEKNNKKRKTTVAQTHSHACSYPPTHLCTPSTQTQCSRPHFVATKSQTHTFKMNFYISSIHIQKQTTTIFTRGHFGAFIILHFIKSQKRNNSLIKLWLIIL